MSWGGSSAGSRCGCLCLTSFVDELGLDFKLASDRSFGAWIISNLVHIKTQLLSCSSRKFWFVFFFFFMARFASAEQTFCSIKFGAKCWLAPMAIFGAFWLFYLELFLQLTSALKVFLFWWGYFHMVQFERGLWQLRICIIIIFEPFFFFICLMSSALPK